MHAFVLAGKIFEMRKRRIGRIERRGACQYIVDIGPKKLQIAVGLQAHESATVGLTVRQPVMGFGQHQFGRSSNLFVRYMTCFMWAWYEGVDFPTNSEYGRRN